jgi:hypothetical protein
MQPRLALEDGGVAQLRDRPEWMLTAYMHPTLSYESSTPR